MKIGIPAETRVNETRIAATPETVKKYVTQGHRVTIQSGAGTGASFPDDAFTAAGAEIVDAASAFGADLVLKVQSPTDAELPLLKRGATLVGMLDPFNTENSSKLAAAGVTAFALEAAPRTTRAQSLDVLSSQANIAGYKAVLLAATLYPRFMPMLMTAAGTVKAARVLILGAGVAGLQAIATAKRLGAVIEASDVRPAVKDHLRAGDLRRLPRGLERHARTAHAADGRDQCDLGDRDRRRDACRGSHVGRARQVLRHARGRARGGQRVRRLSRHPANAGNVPQERAEETHR